MTKWNDTIEFSECDERLEAIADERMKEKNRKKKPHWNFKWKFIFRFSLFITRCKHNMQFIGWRIDSIMCCVFFSFFSFFYFIISSLLHFVLMQACYGAIKWSILLFCTFFSRWSLRVIGLFAFLWIFDETVCALFGCCCCCCCFVFFFGRMA